jgi:hypothetical protein
VDKSPLGPVPWDILVFVALTGIGFTFSVQKYVQSRDLAAASKHAFDEGAPSRTVGRALDLGCLEKQFLTDHHRTFDRELRLSGQFCHLSQAEMQRFGGLRVRNLTTGEDGVIFFQGDGTKFSTGSLTLSEGENRIRLEWRDSATSPVRELSADIRRE